MASKMQRKVNRYVRYFNKSLWEDKLFPQRFQLRQIMKGSGEPTTREDWAIVYIYELKDLKMNSVILIRVDNYNYDRELLAKTNDFIINIREKEGW